MILSQDFWRKYFWAYDALIELRTYQELLDTLIKELNVETGVKILDAGSGTGNLAVALEKIGAKVTGVDYSDQGISLHKAKNRLAVIVQQSLEEKLLFEDNLFDRIVSNNTIYTLSTEGRKKLSKEFYRVLKPGGKIVVSDIIKGYSPFKIYLHHIRTDAKERGIIKMFIKLILFLVPTLKIFYYNFLIRRADASGGYELYDLPSHRQFLLDAGFTNVSEGKWVFADQAVLHTGHK